MKNVGWLGAFFLILPTAGWSQEGPLLKHQATRQLPPGTHRPEILATNQGDLLLVVVQPQGLPGSVGQIKHRAYRFGPNWQPLGKPFVVTQVSKEYGEPADQRAALVNNELVVVYQTLAWKDGKPKFGQGPMERYAKEQSLLLARFSLEGKVRLRKPIVARVSDFSADNFPDHCLLWQDGRLLVSTGSLGRKLKIRAVDLEANILATHELEASEQTIPGTIGNSLLAAGPRLFLFSASGPQTAFLTMTELDRSFRPVKHTQFTDPQREQNFPTSCLAHGEIIFLAYIARDRGGANELFQNPYHPYLKILDKNHQVVADLKIGSGGFAHCHPTIARLGNRLYVAWSKSLGKMPQVQVEEYELSFKR